jgi:hypothetical protein
MHSDPPTIPNLPRYDPGGYDPGGSAGSREPGQLPTWPVAGEGIQHALGPRRPPKGDVRTLVLGASLGANVVLLAGLLGLLLLSQAGLFWLGGASAGSAPGMSTPGGALSRPTATPSATPLSGGWLRVAPSSVQLGCAGSQRNQFVVLANTGPERVHWQVALSVPADQAGVAVAPNQGDLDAGASMPLQIQNMTHAGGPQGVAGQQGVMRFDPTTPAAGPPPSLSFTAVGCQ